MHWTARYCSLSSYRLVSVVPFMLPSICRHFSHLISLWNILFFFILSFNYDLLLLLLFLLLFLLLILLLLLLFFKFYLSPWYNRNGWLGVKHRVTKKKKNLSFASLFPYFVVVAVVSSFILTSLWNVSSLSSYHHHHHHHHYHHHHLLLVAVCIMC